MAVVVEGKGKFAGKKLYLNKRNNLYYFSPRKGHGVDKIPRGYKVAYQTKGRLKGYPYLEKA